MNDLDLIQAALAATGRRRRLERGLWRLWLGLAIGAGAWLLVLGVYKLAPIPAVWAEWAWVVLPVGALAGFLAGWWRVASAGEMARWVDSKRQLQERVSTALEMAGKGEGQEEWRGLLVADAAKRVAGLKAKELLPFHLPAAARWALVLLAVGLGLGFAPEYRSKVYVDKKQDEEVIKKTGQELAQLTKRTMATRPPAMESAKKSLEEVAELGQHLAQAQLTKGEALKDLASVTEKLKEQTRELAKNPAIRNLERAARNPSKSGSPSSDLQQKLEAMAKQSGANAANSEALEKMREDLQKAKDAAENLPKGDSPEAKEAQEKLTGSLADLAKQAKDLGLDLPSLSEAIAALQNTQPDQVLQDLQAAEIELEKMESMAKALEKMQIDAQKLGKDLAEQLKNGQAEAAESTLRKMAKSLESGKMSEEEMKQVMQEVSNAMEAAEQYGEVGEMMKAAMGNMQQGNQAQAGENLGKAANALAGMMGELGDAQSLLATLESLQQASMVIANGMGYSKDGKPAFSKKSGNPTSRGGVGTWHDEQSWEYPEFSDKWDNTGIERPDMDGKGIADRGDGQLADNLAPTKIKGQITPGGPMPSITMKGVSIKGSSKVQVADMAASAQSEAQSALNQDQVPRAYQNSVRNYFDDLKE